MISWIQRYFQHHFKTIFAVLLGVGRFYVGPTLSRSGPTESGPYVRSRAARSTVFTTSSGSTGLARW